MTRSPVLTPPPAALLPPRHPRAPAPGTLIPSHYARCFGCGEEIPGGLHMRVMAGEGLTVTAEFHVTDCHQGSVGLAHGGLLAAAFDEALGAVTSLVRRSTVTARLETDFLAPVPVGSVLHIQGRCDGLVNRKFYVSSEARLNAVDGPVVVTAAALFVLVPLEHFSTHADPATVAEVRAAGTSALMPPQEFGVNP